MVVSYSTGIRDSSAGEGLVFFFLECFFGNVWRGNDYGCYAPKIESHKGSIGFGELCNNLMGFVPSSKMVPMIGKGWGPGGSVDC